jgi:uncharacterized protein YaiI (UPF0178 family)
MKIWVDGDACPNPIKEILFRASRRLEVPLTVVANHVVAIPGSPWMNFVQVRSGLDEADHYIVQHVVPEDLVITADIPLAARIVEIGAKGLNPRGEFYDAGNIRERLSLRNFMDELRQGGVETGGPPALNRRDRENFANQLNQFLSRALG